MWTGGRIGDSKGPQVPGWENFNSYSAGKASGLQPAVSRISEWVPIKKEDLQQLVAKYKDIWVSRFHLVKYQE